MIVALVTVVACHRAREVPSSSGASSAASVTASATVASSAPVVVTVDAGGPTGSALCPGLTKLHDGAIGALPPTLAESLTPLVPGALGRCHPSPRGAWALVFELGAGGLSEQEAMGQRPEIPAPPPAQLRWALRWREMTGEDALVRPALPRGASGSEVAVGLMNLHVGGLLVESLSPPFTFDWDGDGRDELVTFVSSAGSWYVGGLTHGRVWHARMGSGKATIEQYAPAKAIDVQAVRDVDGDGRPDLETFAPFVAFARDAQMGGKDVLVHGPLLVARSLPDGTFTLDHPGAHAAARAYCPRLPSKPRVILDAKGEADEIASGRNVVCARFWGVDSKELLADIERCGQGEACLGRDAWRGWARVAAPFVLK